MTTRGRKEKELQKLTKFCEHQRIILSTNVHRLTFFLLKHHQEALEWEHLYVQNLAWFLDL